MAATDTFGGVDWTNAPLAERKEWVLTQADNITLIGLSNMAGGFGEAVNSLVSDGMLRVVEISIHPVLAGGTYRFALTEVGHVARAMLTDAS